MKVFFVISAQVKTDLCWEAAQDKLQFSRANFAGLGEIVLHVPKEVAVVNPKVESVRLII